MAQYTISFKNSGLGDLAEVGGKNASLGEMITALASEGIRVPDGFSVTVEGFKHFIIVNRLEGKLRKLMGALDIKNFSNLTEIGSAARKLIMKATIPDDLEHEIISSYALLKTEHNQRVAVRSSATAEDLASASFAGQHDSFLNISGNHRLMQAIKKCYASLYTDRAIKYRQDNHFRHEDVFLSVGVQLMVNAEKGCSGIGFTLEPESGFRNVIHLSGIWGLGENIVQGKVTPDEFLVFKPTLALGKDAIIEKKLGTKTKTMVYNRNPSAKSATIDKDTPVSKRNRFVLSDRQIMQLARWMAAIESHYGRPMDVEWAKDGADEQLYILQARPETIHGTGQAPVLKSYRLIQKSEVLARGASVGKAISCGRAKVLSSPKEAHKLEKGDILVTDIATPDWDPIMKKVSGIVTNKGGRTSHAAIVARELGLTAVFGTGNATKDIKDGEFITLDCAESETGLVYKGSLKWKEVVTDMRKITLAEKPAAQFIMSEPEKAFHLSRYPNCGIGLLRIEFIISNYIGVHPMALVRRNRIGDVETRAAIKKAIGGYKNGEEFFVERLAHGIARVAAAFYPKEVIVRTSDFKTNEYAGLTGGKEFEPFEENPMLGFRGASRYYHEKYRDGFRLECLAIKKVRDEMGLTNVKVMIPFCRTATEGRKVIDIMETFGLSRGKNGLQVYVMAEIPSNILEVEAFAECFDGFSIGSNDLTQLTLGIDRDSNLLSELFTERDPAVMKLIATLIKQAKRLNKKVGLCGQAASDSQSFVDFLVREGIDSISFNPDALLGGIGQINNALQAKNTVENPAETVS